MFKIKGEYKQDLPTPKNIKILGSTKDFIDKTNNGENLPSFEVTVLIQCNLVNTQYQLKTQLLYTVTPNRFYACLINVKPSNFLFLKSYNTELDDIILSFIDKNGRPLEVKEKVNLTLLVNI